MLKKRYLLLIMIISLFMISAISAEEITDDLKTADNQLSINIDETYQGSNDLYLINEQTTDELITAPNADSNLTGAANKVIYFDASAKTNGDGSKLNPYKYINQNTLTVSPGSDLTAYFANGIYELNTPFKISSNVVLIGESSENTIFNSVLSNKYDFEIMQNSNLELNNITFYHANIQNHGTIEAKGVIFESGTSFMGNDAPSTYNTKDYGSAYGGVIICDPIDISTPCVYLENCIFNNITAYCGGAISLKNSRLEVKNSKFYNMNVGYKGGVIYAINSNINILGGDFDMNTACYGGVIYCEKSDVDLENTKLYNSYTYSFGGAIASKHSNIDIQSCDLTYYQASTDAGGAIYNFKGNLNVNNTYLRWGFSQYGGAIANLDGNLTVESCYLYKNTAEEGGAIHNTYGNMLIKDNIFYVSRGHMGSVLHSWYSNDVYLINNIIVNSTSNNADPCIELNSFDNIYLEGNHFEDVYYYYLEVTGTLDNEKVTLRSNVLTYILSTTGRYEDEYDNLDFINSFNDSTLKVYDLEHPDSSVIYGDYNELYMIMCNFTGAPDNIRDPYLKYYVCNSMGEIIFDAFHQDKNIPTVEGYGGFFCQINASYRILSRLELTNNVHNTNVPLINSSYSDLNYIPSYYNSNDYGYITPIKNQGVGGNCWAFAGIATLEACIKKITNITYDFSEENAKNSMAIFSSVGLEMNPNEGGFDAMFLGYLANWYGPVPEDWDTYDDLSSISPLYISKFHIQNVKFLPERDGTNDDLYKKAIMDYGAITVGFNWLVRHSANIIGWDDDFNNYDSFGTYSEGAWIFNKVWSSSGEDYGLGYLSFETAYDDSYKNLINKNGATTIDFYPPNYHSVSIVGWDDNYNNKDSLNRYTKGAWIFKNSWGTDWGDDGFGYLGYDIPFLSDYADNFFSYTFEFNEDDYYVAMLQDGITMTDYISNDGPIYCELNGISFISGWGMIPLEEGFSGFSTYFLVPTNYTVSVYNIETEELILNQRGYSDAGYHTIAFDKVISRECGDNFRVVIGYCNDGMNYLPISQVDELTKVYSRAGYTFCSFDGGETYVDLFGYNDQWIEPCIQVFTKIGDYYHATFNIDISEFDNIDIGENVIINFTLSDSGSEISYIYDDSTISLIEDTILTVNINGKDYYTKIHDGKASLDVSFDKAGKYALTAEYKSNRYDSEIAGFNFTVNKINSATKLEYAKNANNVTLTATVSSSATGNVVFTVNGKDHSAKISKGKATYTLYNLNPGTYDVTAKYGGDDNYKSSVSGKITFKIDAYHVNIAAQDVTKTYGGSENLVITLTDQDSKTLANTQVKIKLADETYTKTTDSNGKISMALDLNAGDYDANIIFEGNNKYDKAQKTVKITVNKIDTKTDIYSIQNDYDAYTLTANVTSTISAGDIVITVNGEDYNPEIVDGKAIVKLPHLAAGSYVAKATYKGNVNYKASSSANISFNVENTQLKVSAPNLIKYYGGPERFVVSITDNKGNAVADEPVKVTINGQVYDRKTGAEGRTTFAINLRSGTYNATIEHDGKISTSTITVKTTVKSSDVTKIFRNGTNFEASFLDKNGNKAPAGEKVSININGVFYQRSIKEDGTISFALNLEQGTYILTIVNPVTGEEVANTVKVLPNIIENNDLTKYYRNDSQFTFKLLDDKGNPIVGEKASININGVFYTRTTKENGIATFQINLEPGTYILTLEYKGCRVANTVTVLNVIQTSNIKMKYQDGTRFKVTILDGKGKHYANQSITFNINGVLYNRITKDDGSASLAINLMAGEYIITTTYNSYSVANKVTITS